VTKRLSKTPNAQLIMWNHREAELVPGADVPRVGKYEGPLYATHDPYNPTTWYVLAWSHYVALQAKGYVAILKKHGIMPPIMAGMQLHSPLLQPKERPSDKIGLPGELNMPSSSLYIPSPFLISRILIRKHMSVLRIRRPESYLERSTVVLRSLPMRAPEHPYLVDYCLEDKGWTM